MYDFLVVGAGYAGAVCAERLARKYHKTVLICERRDHIAGNAYDYYDSHGILVHKYGPHVFHTNSTEVFDYLSRFTSWRHFEHHVRASVDGNLVPVPINLNTVNLVFSLDLKPDELGHWFQQRAEKRSRICTSEDVVVSRVGRDLYERMFRGYTRKHWGHDPSELDASVTARIPVRTNCDDRYFTDIYQAMPKDGYTHMFRNMLDHPNIRVMLNTDYREIPKSSYRQMIYTGPIDEFFGYCFGRLPYRSLTFKHETHATERLQPVPVINYPDERIPYTRVTEFKWLTGQKHRQTSIVYEFPSANGDPYYPIPRAENQRLYQQYRSLADQESGVYVVGRLATYKYYDMHQVVAQALALVARIMNDKRREACRGGPGAAVDPSFLSAF